MTRFRSLFAAAALLALPLLATPAQAASLQACRADIAGAVAGPGIWTAPNTGNRYNLNNRGCAIISTGDMGDALAQGFVLAPGDSIAFALGVTASPATISLPASAYIRAIIVEEVSGSNVTGGIMIGTASGQSDVVSALSANARQVAWAVDASVSSTTSPSWVLKKRAFGNAASPTTLFIDSPNTFGQGKVNVTVHYGYF